MDLWLNKYFDYKHDAGTVVDYGMISKNYFDYFYRHSGVVEHHKMIDSIGWSCVADKLAHCVLSHNQFAEIAVVAIVDFEKICLELFERSVMPKGLPFLVVAVELSLGIKQKF